MQVQEGEGWRLLVDPARHPFSVLIGGEGWAAELTQPEALLLAEGVGCLCAQHSTLIDQLLAEEAIALEWESADLWLELEGDRQSWQLRFVLSSSVGLRSIEGSWPPLAASAVAAALTALRAGLVNPA
jgi:hypothetical protein